MKKILLVLLFAVVLSACESNPLSNTHTIIDWVEFVKIDDQQYSALNSVAIANDKHIGDEIGKVEFKVDENVTDPSYNVKNGDAAYLNEGTSLFEVVNMPTMIAVEDDSEVNGYRLYQADDVDDKWRLEDIDKSQIDKVEVQKGYANPDITQSYTKKEDIESLLRVLNTGEEDEKFTPSIDNGDPDNYFLVFYTDQPIAVTIQVGYDGQTWYWYPWEEEILPDEIGGYLK